MSNIPYLNLIFAIIAVALIVFVPFIRRFVFAIIRVAIALGAAFVAIAGISMLMNNETIYEKPGVRARTIRFMTEDHAATSDKGLGSATCRWPDEPTPTPTATPTPAPAAAEAQQKPAPAASPTSEE